ncbi:porin [Paraburkholderia sp. J7]|uniref:porin n=1 Tax=Paraburkholderia sp. J7 TaxID=2805438 RepID=UPI002AB74072|nr:porin [Paraburkholderia sp. J7]
MSASKIFAANVTLVAAIVAWSGIAEAQSSVTLSGVIDTGIMYSNNNGGHASWSTINGLLTPTRWILSGTEDLGGGTRAVFRLINPFSVQNGRNTGRAFNVAYVGLSNTRYGTLSLGRQYDTTLDLLYIYAVSNTWAHVGDSDNTNGSFKVSNAVKYLSPNWAGLQLGATYGFSNEAGQFKNNRQMSTGATYAYGPFSASLGVEQLDHPDSQPAGAVGTAGGGTADDYGTLMFAQSVVNHASVARQRIWLAGTSYRIGHVTIDGLYSKVQYKYLDGSGLTLDNYLAYLQWQIAPYLSTQLAYIHTNGTYSGVPSNIRNPGWDQINIGGQYLLSKRTFIYAIAVGQKGRNANAQILNLSPSSTRRQLAVVLGVQHQF